MPRIQQFTSPFLLGFDEIETALERLTKTSSEGYPPYNIERLTGSGGQDQIRITIAVAGFTIDQLQITLEENQLIIKGNQQEDKTRQFLHQGIAARQFQRAFVLADGLEIMEAKLKDGLLYIDMVRHEPEKRVQIIPIKG